MPKVVKLKFSSKIEILLICLSLAILSFVFYKTTESQEIQYQKTGYHSEKYSIINQIIVDAPMKIVEQNGQQIVKQGDKDRPNFTGLAKDKDGNKWLVIQGKVQYNYSGFHKLETGKKVFIKNGKVNTKYTGCYIDSKGTKRYVDNGKESLSKDKKIALDNKTLQIKNGKVIKEKIKKENDLTVYVPSDLVKLLSDKEKAKNLVGKDIIIIGNTMGISKEEKGETFQLFIDPELSEQDNSENITPVFFICNTRDNKLKLKILDLPKQAKVKITGTVKVADPLLGFEIEIKKLERM